MLAESPTPPPTDTPDPDTITSRQEFADELHRLRERAGLSVRRLARMTELPHSTVGSYLSGRHLPPVSQPEVLPAILRACGVTDPDTVARWCAALGRVRRLPGPRPADAAVPYRGLSSFEPEDRQWFFGRSRLTSRVVRLLGERWHTGGGAVAVVGPSGSGKSSLLRAGVIPALRDGHLPVPGSAGWPVLLMTPGVTPVAALAAQLATVTGQPAEVVAGQLRADPAQVVPIVRGAGAGAGADRPDGHPGGAVLVVDQLEELFTECDDEERRVFINALVTVAGAAAVLLGLRADFYHQALRDRQLSEVLDEAQVAIGPMNEEELREAIVAPARRAGLDVEDGLVELLLRDLAPPPGSHTQAAHEAGALPLLSHALRATWERGTRWRLTVADYEATGGVRGAVANTADRVYESLSALEQHVARRLFVRLVRVGEDTPHTRRRITRAEVDQLVDPSRSDLRQQVLDRFVDERLVTVHTDTVEVTHEALVAAWPRLRDWIDTDRRMLLIGQRLHDAARQWDREDRDPAVLYRGTRLAAAQEWAQTTGQRDLTTLGHEFLQASVRRQRRQTRRLTQMVAALTVLLLLAASGGLFALQQRSAAATERNLALSRMAAVSADRLQSVDPALAAQVAVAAYQREPTTEARSSLLSASAIPPVTRMLGPSAIMQDVALDATRGLLAAASDDNASVLLWDVTDPHRPVRLAATLPGLDDVINSVTLHPDGGLLAAGGAGAAVYLYDVADPANPVTHGAPLAGPGGAIITMAFSPDGQVLAAGSADATVQLWDVSDLAAPTPLATLAEPEAAVDSVAFDPAGQTLAAGDHAGTVHRWDLTDPHAPVAAGEPLTGPDRTVFSVAFSPDGQTVAAASADENAYLWDVTDPSPQPATVLAHPPGSGWLHSVAFSPDGATVVTGSGDGQARLWDVSVARVTTTLPHPGPVTALAFEPDSDAVYTAAADGVVRRWTVPGPVLAGAAGAVWDLVPHPQAPIVVAASGDGHLYLWNVEDPQRPALVSEPLASPGQDSPLVGTVGISPDGNTLAAAGRDGTVWRWDITDPDRPAPVDPPLPELPQFAESLVFSPDGSILAAGDTDGHVQLWDLTDPRRPQPLASMTDHSDNVYSIAFNPHRDLLATGAVDRQVRLWDITDPARPRQVTGPLDGATGYVYSVAFSPDGNTLAVGSADENAYLWDVTDPTRPVAGPVLSGANGYVLWVQFNPDGSQLAAASRDHTVRLWDVDDPAEPSLYAVLTGHEASVNMLGYAPGGGMLATSSSDTTARLWRTDPERVVADLCGVAGDPLTPEEWAEHLPGLPYQPPCR